MADDVASGFLRLPPQDRLFDSAPVSIVKKKIRGAALRTTVLERSWECSLTTLLKFVIFRRALSRCVPSCLFKMTIPLFLRVSAPPWWIFLPTAWPTYESPPSTTSCPRRGRCFPVGIPRILVCGRCTERVRDG